MAFIEAFVNFLKVVCYICFLTGLKENIRIRLRRKVKIWCHFQCSPFMVRQAHHERKNAALQSYTRSPWACRRVKRGCKTQF